MPPAVCIGDHNTEKYEIRLFVWTMCTMSAYMFVDNSGMQLICGTTQCTDFHESTGYNEHNGTPKQLMVQVPCRVA